MVGIGSERTADVLETQILDAKFSKLAVAVEQIMERKVDGTEAV